MQPTEGEVIHIYSEPTTDQVMAVQFIPKAIAKPPALVKDSNSKHH